MTTAAARPDGLWRASRWDALPLCLSLLQGGALIVVLLHAPRALRPSVGGALAALCVAGSLWWGANTIAHNHIHNPFFRRPWQSRAYGALLSAILGVPFALWRVRHLWHHGGEPDRGPRALRGGEWIDVAVVAGLFLALLVAAPGVFLGVYLPGYGLGLLLCQLQGVGEHRGDARTCGGVSHYHWLYNLLWLNDGYHAEHHRHPQEHWTRLPARRLADAPVSAAPPVPRALGVLVNGALAALLVGLERLALRSPALQRLMLRCHGRALDALLPRLALPPAPRVCIVGGGLFPRTLLLLSARLPRARFTVLDDSEASLAAARGFLADHAPGLLGRVALRRGRFSLHGGELGDASADLFVVPLGLRGARRLLYHGALRAPVLVHDWLHRVRGPGVVVAAWLWKRLNLVLPRSGR